MQIFDPPRKFACILPTHLANSQVNFQPATVLCKRANLQANLQSCSQVCAPPWKLALKLSTPPRKFACKLSQLTSRITGTFFKQPKSNCIKKSRYLTKFVCVASFGIRYGINYIFGWNWPNLVFRGPFGRTALPCIGLKSWRYRTRPSW